MLNIRLRLIFLLQDKDGNSQFQSSRSHIAVVAVNGNSPRASNTFNQEVEAKRFEGVFLCRKVC